jgi:hypothetical protein
MNLRAYGMQAGNFGFNTEFGKISINISVLVLLITVYISLLMAPFTGGASAADIGPEVVATRQTISGILSLLATAVGERFGAAALKDLAAAGAKDLATDLATAGAKDLAAGAGKNVAEDVAAAGVKDAAAGAAARVGGQAVARSADSRLSSGVLKVVLQGVVTNVWANIEQLRRDPNASWNWNSTFAAVLWPPRWGWASAAAWRPASPKSPPNSSPARPPTWPTKPRPTPRTRPPRHCPVAPCASPGAP